MPNTNQCFIALVILVPFFVCGMGFYRRCVKWKCVCNANYNCHHYFLFHLIVLRKQNRAHNMVQLHKTMLPCHHWNLQFSTMKRDNRIKWNKLCLSSNTSSRVWCIIMALTTPVWVGTKTSCLLFRWIGVIWMLNFMLRMSNAQTTLRMVQ